MNSVSAATSSCEAWSPELLDYLIGTEKLVDLGEFDGLTRVREDCRLLFTVELWNALEALPFSELGRSSVERRAQCVASSSQRILDELLGDGSQASSASAAKRCGSFAQKTVDFVAPIATRVRSSRCQKLRLHVERIADGELCVTVGFREELRRHPAQLASSSERRALATRTGDES